jgi:hypothetical protein
MGGLLELDGCLTQLRVEIACPAKLWHQAGRNHTRDVCQPRGDVDSVASSCSSDTSDSMSDRSKASM